MISTGSSSIRTNRISLPIGSAPVRKSITSGFLHTDHLRGKINPQVTHSVASYEAHELLFEILPIYLIICKIETTLSYQRSSMCCKGFPTTKPAHDAIRPLDPAVSLLSDGIVEPQ